jgi:phosphate transport system permease protein
VLTAIYLVEYGRGRLARAVSFMVDILTGIPSIVAGLFIYAVWVTTLGLQRVAFAVSLSLVLLMVPTVVRSTEEMLKLVPNELREASYALGVPKWKTIVKVVLPTAFSGITTGILLGLARVMGETAPLLILGPYTKSIATDLFGGYMATLPTMINPDRTESLQPAVDRVWAAALTLILLILILNLAGRLVARRGSVRT